MVYKLHIYTLAVGPGHSELPGGELVGKVHSELVAVTAGGEVHVQIAVYG